MTSITASRGVASITPPSSSHGHRDWDYSVPIDTPDDDGTTYYSYTNGRNASGASRSRTSSLTKARATSESRKTSGSYIRSTSDYSKDTPRNVVTTFAPTEPSKDELLAAPRASALAKPGSNEGRDSVIDLYAVNRLSTISGVTEILPNINSSTTAMYDLSGDIDNREASSWIHRDKLMRIESHEYKKSSAVPVPVPNNASDAWIKTAQRKLSLDRMSKPRASTWDSCAETSEENSNEIFENNDFDLRLPEEREAEQVAQKMAAARSKSISPSKIPVNVFSPAPIPLEFLERNCPLKRARSGSPDEDDVQSISYPATRARSQTLESEPPPVTPPERPIPTSAHSGTPPSRTSIRNGSKSSPRRPSSSQRTSTGKGGKPRTTSAAGNRGSGGNSAGGAAKHNTPEGPPPWALGTYAPDPKLPQDQQIIPTVAKRLQQEQWEREGASASVYDRELRPLKIHDKDGAPKEAIHFGENHASLWPSSKEKKRERDPPPMVEPPSKPSQPQEVPPKPPAKEPIRVKDPEEVPGKGKKDKGCCGCTIM
ncbi:hypothetical protein Dda_6054 [Drechslerella dactyloides]|uniref:TeaA receptor TeaR n=1 Tax=Drechslerella dactyloides TaxID=74499 RepID=A0AAD6IZ21_DREDA|nr:hypothetical protein Dda_6054 [Drechslerella dactyloides]